MGHQVFSLDRMKSAFKFEKQQIIPPSPRNMVIGHGILLLGVRSLFGWPPPRHSALGMLTPIEYEMLHRAQPVA